MEYLLMNKHLQKEPRIERLLLNICPHCLSKDDQEYQKDQIPSCVHTSSTVYLGATAEEQVVLVTSEEEIS